MSRDDIIRMAREADPFGMVGRLYAIAQLTPETLERFASLVAEAEREAILSKATTARAVDGNCAIVLVADIRARSTP